MWHLSRSSYSWYETYRPNSSTSSKLIEKARPCRSRFFYNSDKSTLLITIPANDHEMLHAHLSDKIFLETARMKLDHEFLAVGSTSEGDSCYTVAYKPWSVRRVRPSGKAWPTLAAYFSAAGRSIIQFLLRRIEQFLNSLIQFIDFIE